MPPARTYWTIVAVFAAFFGFVAYKAVGPRAERPAVALEIVEPPAGWKGLPVVARATPEVTTPRPGAVDHTWQLGPFALHREETARSGPPRFDVAGAGMQVPRVVEVAPPYCAPDTLHEDKGEGVFVLAQGERACAALRAKRAPGAGEGAGKSLPLVLGLMSAAAVFLVAGMVRKLS